MVSTEIEPQQSNYELSSENSNNQNDIRILLVDDRASIRQSLQLSLESKPDLKIIGSVADGSSAVSEVKTLHPDIVLIDIEMPGMNGLEATQIIKEQFQMSRRSFLAATKTMNTSISPSKQEQKDICSRTLQSWR